MIKDSINFLAAKGFMNTRIYKSLLLAVLLFSAFTMFGCGALAPSISVTVSHANVVVGGTAVLVCEAISSTAKTLIYSWSMDDGILSSTTGKTVTWTAPTTPGTYFGSVAVNDGSQSSSCTISIPVIVNVPVIQSVTANPTSVAPGGTVHLSCEAISQNGKTISYKWKSTSGSLLADSGPSVTWTAPPTIGTYAITVEASDDYKSTSATLGINVASLPLIQSLTATANTITVGSSTVLTCTTATPPPGSTLNIYWGTSGGSLSSTIGPSVTFSTLSTLTPGTYTITVTVSDPANPLITATASSSINVIAAVAPSIQALTASLNPVSTGVIITLTCTATDPNPITYHWAASGGTPLTNVGNPVQWTASSTGTYEITVTVSNPTASASGKLHIIVQ